ncbi:hypothetical protein J4558_06950 [Leptolyngbya sp. 15MV]|nr:hypothetical protein J4558_06950 [Leptolyngbya sp. 15MV]
MLETTPTEILVEPPAAAGSTIEFEPGVPLVAVMSVGQNRWMFVTQNLGNAAATWHGRPTRAMRLRMPEHVERCQRRNFYRVSTVELNLPTVEVWSIINPTTVGPAEVANRTQILDLLDRPQAARPNAEPAVLPEVGPKFTARLMNVGGGGVGLLIEPHLAQAIDRSRYFWLRLDLTPTIPAPLAMTARLAHTHIDSLQNVYAGMAFEWPFNAGHRDFVVEQIRRYATSLQRAATQARRHAA